MDDGGSFRYATRMKVLIVDDEGDMRRLIRGILGPAHEVLEASSGREALRLVRREKPRLVLLDVSMPQLDGHAVLSAIRGLDPTVAVVMLTADHRIEAARAALQSGAVSYVTKPFEPEALLAEVARASAAPAFHRGSPSPLPWRVAGAEAQ